MGDKPMSNTAENGQQSRSVVADMTQRAAAEAPAAEGQHIDPNAGQNKQGADNGQQAQTNGAADDLSKLTTEQLVAKLKDAEAEKLRARQEADRITHQHKKVLKDWNAQNMRVKTSAERGEIGSKAARELTQMAPGIDPENPFGFMQRDNAEKHLSVLERVNPDARFYFGAFLESIKDLSVDEAEQVAREFLTEEDDAKRVALAINRGKDALPEAKLARLQRVAKAGDPIKVIEEMEGNFSNLQTENAALKARLAELENQAAMTVPSRQPLRSAGEPTPQNVGDSVASDKPLGVQIAERRKAALQARSR
jgi:hypothetical protein